MSLDNQTLSSLVDKYFKNQLSENEYNILWKQLNEYKNENELNEVLHKVWLSINNAEVPVIPNEVWDSKMSVIKQKITESSQLILESEPRTSKLVYIRWAAAAVLVLLATSVYYLIDIKVDKKIVKNINTQLVKDRLPGGDRAVLTLADGSTILLDSAANGILAKQGNTQIIKTEDGQLQYNNDNSVNKEVAYNTLQTPKGGQYNITLPDGSKVWLNAASSLKYPTAFLGQERKVEITGEAYFEITKNASKPFKVVFNNMEVQVLGTHFNVKAYSDEELIRTTLLEGKIKIITPTENQYLAPGQQAQLSSSGMLKKVSSNVDLEETIAWKNGNFQFENNSIQEVMRQLARWYDVDVSYKGNITKHFIGSISRNVNLSKVLSMLQQTGEVKFLIEGKKVIVMP